MIEHSGRPPGLNAPGVVRIYPVVGATGLWDTDGAVLDPEVDLGLPADLVARFRRWIRDYERLCEPSARVDARVLAAFDAEGLALADATKDRLGPGRGVFFAPEAQYHLGTGPKWVEV